MRNRLLTLAGGLALLAVIGKFYAGPAIAQTVRAALVQDRDNPARQAFTYEHVMNPPNTNHLGLPTPPPGKRRIINGIYVSMSSFTACSANLSVGSFATGTLAGTFSTSFAAPVLPVLGGPVGSLTPVQIVVNSGDLADLSIYCSPDPSQSVVSLTGYDIDIP